MAVSKVEGNPDEGAPGKLMQGGGKGLTNISPRVGLNTELFLTIHLGGDSVVL